MGQMMFTKYLVVVDGGVDVHNTGKSSSASAPSPARNALAAPKPWKAEQHLD